jgi:dTDP-4-dehydrorhamnose 3,5-epimerase-like enzyme
VEFTDATTPFLVNGGRFVDDRGYLTFFNELDLKEFRRFYVIENHSKGFVRAWHGHLKEAKAFIPFQGAFLVGAARLTDPIKPAKDVEVFRHVLDSGNPKVFYIPKGYANGLMSLTESAKLLVLSTSSLEESQGDDYRLPHDYWDIWTIANR